MTHVDDDVEVILVEDLLGESLPTPHRFLISMFDVPTTLQQCDMCGMINAFTTQVQSNRMRALDVSFLP
jgi:hypothetical protein